jgi:hypothetical protein
MFPDLRLLISATVATFFLAATAGLYASLRITQDQIAARADARAALEENPIMRITNSWPLPEPNRAAALRDLTKLPSGMPIVAATEPESAPERSEPQIAIELPHSPPVNEPPLQITLRETTAPEITHSTGIAVPPEKAETAVPAPDQPDIHGNIGEPAAREQPKLRHESGIQPARKKTQVTVKKVVRVTPRRKKPAPLQTTPADQLITGYPLYLTVPVTN